MELEEEMRSSLIQAFAAQPSDTGDLYTEIMRYIEENQKTTELWNKDESNNDINKDDLLAKRVNVLLNSSDVNNNERIVESRDLK